MSVPSRILLGMAVGVVFGLALGPRSPLLSRDEVTVPRGRKVSLLARPAAGQPLQEVAGRAHLAYLGSATVGGARWHRVRSREQVGWVAASQVTAPHSRLGRQILAVVRPVGTIFLRLLMMLVVPLVFASLAVGVHSLGDVRRLGRVGVKTLVYYLATTAIAVGIGLAGANLVRPGRFLSQRDRQELLAAGSTASLQTEAKEQPRDLGTWLEEVVPRNPIRAAAQGRMLQIIFFALFFGICLSFLTATKAQPVVGFLEGVNQAMIRGVDLVMALAPYGVAALLADVVGSTGLRVLVALGVYALVVAGGLVLHVAFTYGAAVRVLARRSFREFLRAVRPAQVVAFSTSSSAATLPVTLECAEQSLDVPGPIASFVLPLGATMNMDGTALYQAVAAVFVAQVFGVHLDLTSQLAIGAAAVLASVGAAAIPSSGIVLLATVLRAANLPMTGVALILGMDRILDMLRTTVNVTGDLSAAAVVARWEPLESGDAAGTVAPSPGATSSGNQGDTETADSGSEEAGPTGA